METNNKKDKLIAATNSLYEKKNKQVKIYPNESPP